MTSPKQPVYYYKPSKNSDTYLKIFFDYDEDAHYRLNLKAKTSYSLQEIIELKETHLIDKGGKYDH